MSELRVNKAVVHALVKEQHGPIQHSILRDELLDPASDPLSKLIKEVNSIYGARNNGAHYGTFREGDGKGNFPDQFHHYASINEPSDAEFMTLSRVAMDELYRKAENSTLASGGYILFADYVANGLQQFLIAMIKQKEGLTITKRLEIEELMQLDLNRLHQAARINFSKYQEYLLADEEDRSELVYLSFVSPIHKRTAPSYFITALGCQAGAAAARATRTLVQESTKFFREHEDLKARQRDFRSALLQYLEEKEATGESVRLTEVESLARQFIPAKEEEQQDNIANALISHLNSDECAVPVEFPVVKSALTKFTQIAYKSDYWQIRFERNALGVDEGAQIQYEREEKRLTIKDLPAQLAQTIEEELKEREISE